MREHSQDTRNGRHAQRRYRFLHSAATSLITLLMSITLAACAGSNPSGGGPGGGDPANPFRNATSVSCDRTRGAEALYWDFMNGILRADYPDTVRFLPYSPGSSFIHPQQPLYSFIYPSNWDAVTLTDPSSQLTGANVVRPDGRAVWRRLNFSVSGYITAREVIEFELEQMRSILGISGPTEGVCAATAGDGLASSLVRAGEYTANLSSQVSHTSGPGGVISVVFMQLAVAPTAEYESTTVNVFFPLSGQMNLGGGSSDTQCSDGIDNDGDGKTDFPDDEGCTSEADDSEN